MLDILFARVLCYKNFVDRSWQNEKNSASFSHTTSHALQRFIQILERAYKQCCHDVERSFCYLFSSKVLPPYGFYFICQFQHFEERKKKQTFRSSLLKCDAQKWISISEMWWLSSLNQILTIRHLHTFIWSTIQRSTVQYKLHFTWSLGNAFVNVYI